MATDELAGLTPTIGVRGAGSGKAPDTHWEMGGISLRFREMIVFRPTLVYPEYLIAYRRV